MEDTDDNTRGRMGVACWISMAPDTHSNFIPLIAFPRQQLLHKCVSIIP